MLYSFTSFKIFQNFKPSSIFGMGVGVASIAKIMTEFFDDRTHIENLIYKLNDEVNGDADYSRVPGRPVHSKIDEINF